jgi:hypothetical protein
MPLQTPTLFSHALQLALCAVSGHSWDQPAPQAERWQAGVVLDAASTSRKLGLGARDQGASLGHSDVLLRGVLNEHLSGEAILGFHSAERKLEHHIENAWFQTRATPMSMPIPSACCWWPGLWPPDSQPLPRWKKTELSTI